MYCRTLNVSTSPNKDLNLELLFCERLILFTRLNPIDGEEFVGA